MRHGVCVIWTGTPEDRVFEGLFYSQDEADAFIKTRFKAGERFNVELFHLPAPGQGTTKIMSSDRSLNHLFPDFRAKVQTILDLMDEWCSVHLPGHTAMMVEGFRTTAYQQELYSHGRTTKGPVVTQKNGTTNPSNHQSSCAADIVPKDASGNILWNAPNAFWAYLAHCARANGLIAGFDWSGFVDEDHIEEDTHNMQLYVEAHKWQQANGLR